MLQKKNNKKKTMEDNPENNSDMLKSWTFVKPQVEGSSSEEEPLFSAHST